MAGGSIGSLAVGLVLKTDKFGKGVKQSRTALDSFKSSISTTKSALASLGAGLGAAALFASFQRTANAMDNVTDAAQRIGISTKALGGLGHAAQLSGSSLETLSKGLERMMRSESGIAKLGIDVDRLRAMRADQVFLEIGEAIRKLPSRMEQSSAAMAIFGRRGMELLPMLTSGRKAMEALMLEAEGLGVAFSEEEAARVAAYNDEMDRLKATLRGLAQEITVGVAPAMKEMIGKIRDTVELSNFLKSGGDFASFESFRKAGEAWRRTIDSMPGSRFDAFSQQMIANVRNPRETLQSHLGTNVSMASLPHIMAAIRDRIEEQGRQQQEMVRKAEGGAGSGLVSILAPGMALAIGAAMKEALNPSTMAMSLAEIHRIRSQVGGFLTGQLPRGGIGAGAGFDMQVRGNAALERGTAAAFSQERRSAQQNQMLQLQKDSLKENKEQTRAMKNIDLHLRNAVVLEAANFVG